MFRRGDEAGGGEDAQGVCGVVPARGDSGGVRVERWGVPDLGRGGGGAFGGGGGGGGAGGGGVGRGGGDSGGVRVGRWGVPDLGRGGAGASGGGVGAGVAGGGGAGRGERGGGGLGGSEGVLPVGRCGEAFMMCDWVIELGAER